MSEYISCARPHNRYWHLLLTELFFFSSHSIYKFLIEWRNFYCIERRANEGGQKIDIWSNNIYSFVGRHIPINKQLQHFPIFRTLTLWVRYFCEKINKWSMYQRSFICRKKIIKQKGRQLLLRNRISPTVPYIES